MLADRSLVIQRAVQREYPVTRKARDDLQRHRLRRGLREGPAGRPRHPPDHADSSRQPAGPGDRSARVAQAGPEQVPGERKCRAHPREARSAREGSS